MAAIEVVTLMLLAISWTILRNWRIAGLLVTLVLFLFFSYGHVLEAIADYLDPDYAKNQYLVIIWPALFIAGAALLLRFRSKLLNLANPLNAMALILVIFTLPNTLLYDPPSAASLSEQERNSFAGIDGKPVDLDMLPDIWYITAEGYSDEITIQSNLDYDISPFIDYLVRNGFYVASESYSNYETTQNSLASSLNMLPIHQLLAEDSGLIERGGLYPMISDSKAMRFARQHGYEIVYLADRFPSGREELGDTFFGCGARRLGVHVEGFVDALLMSTALHPIFTHFSVLEPGLNDLRVCTFLQLARAKELAGPKVVSVHLTVPGYPFVIGPGGEVITSANSPDRYAQAYRSQLEWTNQRLEWFLDILLSDSEYSPVIVIQGDHGESAVQLGLDDDDDLRAGFRIMNAYRLPDGGDSLLYPSISPINTFRVIFNYYLGADFDLLEDRNYAITGSQLEFIDVTEVVRRGPSD
jgi:hypothetical protein